MSDTVKVVITANATVLLRKTVEMKQADYALYRTICNKEGVTSIEIDHVANEIAIKCGVYYNKSDIEDIDTPEDIEFELVK
ncbi:hypothetical protein M8W91_002777 [Salmonella enterica]|nr:hypothetical protein [Salmonella enterica]EJF5828955.1 hypothetical protein [Salmonella enterica]EJF5856652.1 hypothetical protein [Salmonella enterica]EJF5948017.1 hypothetical protein [Salmonella enterica]EJF6158002.1 hypothetical protein [Salmonella enterica]